MRRRGRSTFGACILAAAAVVLQCAPNVVSAQGAARFVREIPWAAAGTWVPADLHVHTRFSDGGMTVEEIADAARKNGCGALVIADHGDRSLRGATPAWRAAIEAVRTLHPDMLVIPALEWNVPPFGGDEHATVFIPPGPRQWDLLAEFKTRFDHFDRDDEPDVSAALRWLASTGIAPIPPVVIYNHPNRKAAPLARHIEDFLLWRKAGDLVVGFEGAPGHQGLTPTGAYARLATIDRWDPVAAAPGDLWDTLLARGIEANGAIANSDFHSTAAGIGDRLPCQFAETWLRVPEVTESGVLQALRSGTTVGVHGHIARDIELAMMASGLSRPALSGEAIQVPPGASVTVTLSFVVPDRDWQGQPNSVDTVEFIVVTREGAQAVSRPVEGAGRQTVSYTFDVGAGGAVVRARGRRTIADGPDLLFYTNPIRVLTAAR